MAWQVMKRRAAEMTPECAGMNMFLAARRLPGVHLPSPAVTAFASR